MPRRRVPLPKGDYLEHTVRVRVRFQEVDSLRIVWHGHYVSYLEDARVALGEEYGIGYNDIANADLVAPIVKLSCNYLAPTRRDEELDVTARLVCDGAPKLVFYYEIRRAHDGVLAATGETVQVFTNIGGDIMLTAPKFLTAFLEGSKHRMSSSDDRAPCR